MGMDQSIVRSVVEDAIQPMKLALGLGEWGHRVRYRACEGGSPYPDAVRVAECSVEDNYRTVSITINPAGIIDEDDLLDVLRHELLHTFHHGFELYRRQANIAHAEQGRAALDEAWAHGAEAMVLQLEELCGLNNLTPRRLVEIGRRLSTLQRAAGDAHRATAPVAPCNRPARKPRKRKPRQ